MLAIRPGEASLRRSVPHAAGSCAGSGARRPSPCSQPGAAATDEAAPTEVVLVTHDSFAISKEVRQRFERESGLRLRILQAGDANETLNRALLTAGDPQGDVIFGIDDSVLSRALEGDLLEEYRSGRARRPSDGDFHAARPTA